MIGICNACGEESVVRWLKLPENIGYDQLSEHGQNYCEPCFNSLRKSVLQEIGKWSYGDFDLKMTSET